MKFIALLGGASGQSQRERRQQPAYLEQIGYLTRSLALAAAVFAIYFVTAWLSNKLLRPPFRESVFTYPPGGIAAGILIVLGPRAVWAVAAGVAVAAYTHIQFLPFIRPIGQTVTYIIGDVGQVLIVAGLVEHFFGRNFSLDRLRDLLGLFLAAVVSSFAIATFAATIFKLLFIPTAPILTIWQHVFTGLLTGIVSTTPLVIGLGAVMRHPPQRGELLEAAAAIAALTLMTGIIVLLPPEPWETVLPAALLFPFLVWLAVRCRPVFAAAGVFIVSSTIIWTTIYGVGHFGERGLPIDGLIVQSQAIIMFVAVGTCVLAALFSERKANEARLAQSKMMLERERGNRLMSIEAITTAIVHEVKQPLTAITANGAAARAFLNRTPPDIVEVDAALSDIVDDSRRIKDALESTRTLFTRFDQEHDSINVNAIALEVLQSMRGELREHGITAHTSLTSEMPLIRANRNQLHQVVLNLAHNAVEAMVEITDRSRVLQIRTELYGQDAIALTVEDSGSGIHPERVNEIFNAFETTKPQGMGLGLAICRRIVERHGGQLTASSDGKNGTLFQLFLPIKTPVVGAPEA